MATFFPATCSIPSTDVYIKFLLGHENVVWVLDELLAKLLSTALSTSNENATSSSALVLHHSGRNPAIFNTARSWPPGLHTQVNASEGAWR